MKKKAKFEKHHKLENVFEAFTAKKTRVKQKLWGLDLILCGLPSQFSNMQPNYHQMFHRKSLKEKEENKADESEQDHKAWTDIICIEEPSTFLL